MPQSFDSVILHLVFSTKNRHPFLAKGFRERVHAEMSEACRDWGAKTYRVGGVEDHAHLAVTLPRTKTIADLVKQVKTVSSKWIKHQPEGDQTFAWQSGYGVFSISRTHLEDLITYIENQETHHQRCTFQDEFRGLLRKHELQWDEAYVWD